MVLGPLAVLVFTVAAVACGGGPMPTASGALTQLPLVPSPSPASEWLQPGRYGVFIGGSDFQLEPFRQICSPTGLPPAGKFVRTEIELNLDGDWLAGHAVESDIDLEVRLKDGGPGLAGRGRVVTGEVRGWATDRGDAVGPATGVTIRIGGVGGQSAIAVVTGETFPAFGAPLSMLGSAEGPVVFADTQNRTSNCPTITFNVGRRSP